MRRLLRPLIGAAAFVGFDVYRTSTLRQLPRFTRDALAYRRRARGSFALRAGNLAPILTDFGQAGIARGQYFHQDLWASRLIHARRPASHLDIGSRIDGFVAHLLTFMPVTVIDIRPLETRRRRPAIRAGRSSVGSTALPPVRSIRCPACTRSSTSGSGGTAITVDPEGWRVALRELARVLAPGGRLYLGTPIGRERVCFNSERVFSPQNHPRGRPGPSRGEPRGHRRARSVPARRRSRTDAVDSLWMRALRADHVVTRRSRPQGTGGRRAGRRPPVRRRTASSTNGITSSSRGASFPIAGLPEALRGLRIGFMTDIHRSQTVSHELVDAAVQMLMAERPDLIVLGGDYVTWRDQRYVQPAAESLAPLTAPLGVHRDPRQSRRRSRDARGARGQGLHRAAGRANAADASAAK